MAAGSKRPFSEWQAFGKTSGLFAHKRKLGRTCLHGKANMRSGNKAVRL